MWGGGKGPKAVIAWNVKSNIEFTPMDYKKKKKEKEKKCVIHLLPPAKFLIEHDSQELVGACRATAVPRRVM